MGAFIIIAVVVLVTIISVLVFLIARSVFLPKKVESLPKLLKQNKTQNAIKLAKHIILKNPNNFGAHYYLGKAYIMDNKTELALMEYKLVNDKALFGQGIDEVSFRNEYGKLLLDHHQTNEALKNLILLSKLDPRNAENLYNIGILYKENNRYDLALGFMKKAIAINSRHAKAHAELGLIYYRMKQYAEAKKEIDTAIQLNPETYTSYYYLGKINKDGKDYLTALKCFEKAQRDPELKLKAIIEHGSCYMMANRIENAAVDFQRAIELDKDNSNPETLYARYFLASCYEKNRKLDLAIEQWELIYKRNKSFKDVPAKLSEYKDLNANDYLKDYLTCSNEEFVIICKNAADKGMKFEVLSSESKKWGCQLTAVDRKDESWMAVRKLVSIVRFYREPNPLEEPVIHEVIESFKKYNSVKAYILSSSGFSLGARRYADGRPVELIDKQKLETILTNAGSK